jgi:hypothetical protein
MKKKGQLTPEQPQSKKKQIVIVAIAAVAVLVLVGLLYFSGQFTGRAFFAPDDIGAGIADPGTLLVGEAFTLPIQANIGAAETVAIRFSLDLPDLVDCTSVTVSSGLVWSEEGLMLSTLECLSGTVIFDFATIDPRDAETGLIDVAQVTIPGLPVGEYDFSFSEFKVVDLNEHKNYVVEGGTGTTVIVEEAPECGVDSYCTEKYGEFSQCVAGSCATVCPVESVSFGIVDSSCEVVCKEGFEFDGKTCLPIPCVVETWYQDADADGYGNEALMTGSCEQPLGYVADSSDCDDTNPVINPSASDNLCDGVDNNCDGVVDEDAVCSVEVSEPVIPIEQVVVEPIEPVAIEPVEEPSEFDSLIDEIRDSLEEEATDSEQISNIAESLRLYFGVE